MSKFKIVTSLHEVDMVIDFCKKTGYMAHDFETCKGRYHTPGAYPTILGICFQFGFSYIIPLGHKESPFRDIYPHIIQKIGKELIENSKVVKIAHNLKHEAHWWKNYGIELRGICHDSMLAKHLLDEEKPHGLKPLVDRFIPKYSGYELPGSKSEKFDWENVPLEELSKYCGIDSDTCFQLMMWFEQKLIKGGFYNLYRNLTLMQVRVLMEAEHHGLLIDRPYLEGLKESYAQRISEKQKELRSNRKLLRYESKSVKEKRQELIRIIQEEIEELEANGETGRKITTRMSKINNLLAGNVNNKKEAKALEPINFESPKQLINFLFVSKYGLKLPIIKYTMDKKTKKKTKTPSTDESVLKELEKYDESGFIKCMLDLRKLVKFNSTYVVGILEKLEVDNYIHGSFLIHGTVTGRLSSQDPNLQNIPRGTTAKDIKMMFIPPPGYLLAEYDFSQAELRFAAEMYKDKKMIGYFREGYDVHIATAADISKLTYDKFRKIVDDPNHPKYIWAVKSRKKAKCYSPDTEVLTEVGWIRLDKYNGEKVAQYDFGKEIISFTDPIHWGKTYSEQNFIYEDRNISIHITSDHKTPFITRNGIKCRLDFKELVGKNGYVPSSGYIEKTQYDLSKLETRFMAMVAADGCIRKHKAIRFGFSKERKIIRCEKILNELNLRYSKSNKSGKTTFYLPYQPQVFDHIFKYLNRDKELSWETLHKVDGKVYLDEAKYWDATFDDRWEKETSRFFSIKEKTIDVMQAMGTIHGIRVIKYRRESKNRVTYRISYNPEGKTLSRVNFNNVTIDNEPKWMWGITVPTENLVTRRNNKVCISGNTYNFGILYGQTPPKLAESVKENSGEEMTIEQAKEFEEQWFENFKGIKKGIKATHKFVTEHGYVRNLFGRKRRLPDALIGKGLTRYEINNLPKSESGKYFKALRDSVNAPIQGSASDVTQLAAIMIWFKNIKGELPYKIKPMVYTVHDSQGYYLKPEQVHDMTKVIIEICSNPDTKKYFGFEFKYVNMKAEAEMGTKWGTLKDYNPTENYEELLTKTIQS